MNPGGREEKSMSIRLTHRRPESEGFLFYRSIWAVSQGGIRNGESRLK